MKFDKEKTKRILVIRPDAIGDLVLTLPAIQTLKKNFPQAEITALIREYTKPVLENHPAIDKLIYDYDFMDHNFDLCVNFYNQGKDSFAVLKAGIPYRLGDSARIMTGWMNNLRVFRKWDDFTRHEVEFNLDLLGPLSIQEKETKPSIFISPAALQKTEQLLHNKQINPGEPLIGIHIGAATSKAWSVYGFSELISWLKKNTGAKILLLGGEKEIERGEKIAQIASFPLSNFVGKLDLSELIALTSKLIFFVGMDTGISHIAASFGIPMVMLCLTKRAKPLRWGPWQTRHLVVVPDKVCPKACFPSTCSENFCVEETSPAQVSTAVDTVLKGGGISTRLDSLYHWAQKSLGVAIVHDASNQDRAEKIGELLKAGGYRYYLTKVNNFKQLLDFFICHDTLIIHRIGGAAPLASFIAQQLTGSYMATRALLVKDKGESFSNCRELIDFYFNASRKRSF